MSTERFSFNEVPQQNRCRLFVRHGAHTMFDRGFRSKGEASEWIDGFNERRDWRAGFVFRLKGDIHDISIVNRKGELARV